MHQEPRFSAKNSTKTSAKRTGSQRRNSVRNTKLRYTRNVNQWNSRKTGTMSGIAVALVIMILVSMLLLIVQNVSFEKKNIFSEDIPFENPNDDLYGPDLTPAQRDAYLTQYVTVTADDVHRGPTILVNTEYPYVFPEEQLLSSVFLSKTDSYKAQNGSLYLHPETITALNDMADAFYAKTQNPSLMVSGAYRTYEQQQEHYDTNLKRRGEKYTTSFVQIPGASEHHTGYGFDLATYDTRESLDALIYPFSPVGEYYWVTQNCAQYGFVLRYPPNKDSKTGLSYKTWHYRYVGVAHALVMEFADLVLEEYVDFIREYTYDGKRYYINAANGDAYVLYFVPYNGEETQKIPILRRCLSYTVSGNNIDGFIVAGYLGEDHEEE